MSNKERAKEEIKLLVEKYNRLVEAGKVKSYNEEMTKKDFILPLFRALGWSVEDGEEVTAEEKISKGRVDYAFRIQSIPKLFLEAKSLKEDLDKIDFAEQAINYAWHKGATWAVLTDFEGIKVFNAEWKSTNPLQNLFFSLNCNQFLERFEQLWLLSRESLESGAIDTEAEKWGKKAKKVPVDKQLLSDLTRFRELLTKNILKNNASKNLSAEELDEAIQRIIDRLIFIRTLEDKQLEAPILQSLIREDRTKRAYKKLNNTFRKIDDIYNSKLFAFHLCEELNIDDDVLEKIIYGLFKTSDEAVHYDFSAIDADVLGNIYEQYLGYILKKTEKRGKLVEGKAHRKEQGIYYTPTYVVDYIVKNTIGELAKDKKFDLKNIKILDPACGSGSFLMKAFDYLVTLDKKKDGEVEQTKLDVAGTTATYGRKMEILKNNIFGVDLDPKAVEIAQLNLLLKAAEKKHRLPTLQENIKVGNSLIDDPSVAGDKAFKWEEEFKEIIDNGGFDVVIGNPPYVRIHEFDNSTKKYFSRYVSATGQYDLYVLFIEKALGLLKEGGLFGFIISNKFLISDYGIGLRKLILYKSKILKIIDVSNMDIFKDASVYPVIIIFQKISKEDIIKKNKIEVINNILTENELLNKKSQKYPQVDMINNSNMIIDVTSTNKTLINKIEKNSYNIGEIAKIGRGFRPPSKELASTTFTNGLSKYLIGKDLIGKYKIKWSGNYVRYEEKKIAESKPINVFQQQKILIRDIGKKFNASYDNGTYLCLKTIYFIYDVKKIDIKALLGILNSRVMHFYFTSKFSAMHIQGGYLRFRKQFLEILPIKISSDSDYIRIVNKVDKIINLNEKLISLEGKQTDQKAQLEKEIKKTDEEINDLVYKLYDITEEEKKIIEESLK